MEALLLSLTLAFLGAPGECIPLPVPMEPLSDSSSRLPNLYITLIKPTTPSLLSVECYFSFYFPNRAEESHYLLMLPLDIESPSIALETGEGVKRRLAPWEALLRREYSRAPLRVNLVGAWRGQASFFAPLARAHPWALPPSPFTRFSVELKEEHLPFFAQGDFGRPVKVRWEVMKESPEFVERGLRPFVGELPHQWRRLIIQLRPRLTPAPPLLSTLRFRVPILEGKPLRLRYPLPHALGGWFLWMGPERWEVETLFLASSEPLPLLSRSLSPRLYSGEEIMGRWGTPWSRVILHQARAQGSQLLLVQGGSPLEFVLHPPSSSQGQERKQRLARYERSWEAWWDRHGLSVMRWALGGEGILLSLLVMGLLLALWRRGGMGQLDWPWLALPALVLLHYGETRLALSLNSLFPPRIWFLAQGTRVSQDLGLFLGVAGPGIALLLNFWRRRFQQEGLSPEEWLFWLTWPLLGLTIASCGKALALWRVRAETVLLLPTPFLNGLGLYLLWRFLLDAQRTSLWSCLTLSLALTMGYFWLSPLMVRSLLFWAR